MKEYAIKYPLLTMIIVTSIACNIREVIVSLIRKSK